MNIQWNKSQRGGIYVVTLITVAAIASMVLIGVNLRSSTNRQSALIEHMVEGSNGVLDAAELTIERVISDSAWKETAKTGVVFSDLAIADSIYTSTVVDADTSAKPDDSTTTYRITVAANHDTAQSKARFDIVNSTVNYVGVLMDLGATHYWPMNEPEGSNTTFDKIGSYHGNYLLATTSGTGTNDEGATVPDFADNSDHIEIRWGSDFDLKAGTIAYWMKCKGATDISIHSMFGMEYRSGGLPSINMSIEGLAVSAYIDDDGITFGDTNYATTAKDLIKPGVWHHIAMRWGINGLTIFVDGVREARNVFNKDWLGTAMARFGGEQPLRIGAGFETPSLTQTEVGFDGSIAHFAFIPVELGDAKIAELAAIKPDLVDQKLIADSWVRVFD